MSTKCPKNVAKKCHEKNLKNWKGKTSFGHFLDNFGLFGQCLCLVTLSNARPLQMCSGKGVVNKPHAGWSINRTPGEFINCGPFIQVKGLLGRNPTGGKV